MVHEKDPRQTIYEQIGMKKPGKLPGYEVFGNRILIGIYERPEKTKSGIYITDGTRKEDEHQGKSGLVLMLGPNAFVSDRNYDFKDQKLEPGDWISVFVNDGRKIVVNGQLCRIVADQDITFRIPAPDAVF